jgi:hypothetical protein
VPLLRHAPRWVAGLGLLAAALSVAACRRPTTSHVAGVPDVVDFNFDVKPILSDRCFKCHGPDERARKASLRLDVKEVAFGKLPSGHRAIVPGDTGSSELVSRITSTDPKRVMPAADSNLTLTDTEKAILVRWIEQGADWKPHWSFIAPRKPALPAVHDAAWPRNPIDRFVLASLEAKGRHPAPEASRETLIRRATLDLTGLPPTIAEIDAFLADRSPNAYERVVDRLLASPAYGERMAADWLDVARYADSHGYQDDGMRQMWPWRDWVISAFNRNMPFDRFVTWQLAGDLLPDPTIEQRLATAFNRNHMQTQEGGVVPEEYRNEYVVDRVNTFGRAFLGLTVECARCHDHKYDPISQQDFYRLYSFFNNVNETGEIPYSGVPSPTVILVDEASRTTLDTLHAEMQKLESGLDALAGGPAFDAWVSRARAEASHGRVPDVSHPPGLIAYLPLDRAVPRVEVKKADPKSHQPATRTTVLTYANEASRTPARLGGDKDRVPQPVPGHFGQGIHLVGDSFVDLGDKVGLFERNHPFSIGLWMRIDEAGATGPLVTRSSGLFNGNRGYEIILRKDGTFTAGLHHVFPDNSIEIETTSPVQAGAWHHLALTYDGSSRAAGIHLFLDGRLAPSHVTIDHLRRSILKSGDPKNQNWGDMPGLRIGRRHDETLENVSVDELRVYDRQLTSFEVASLGGDPSALPQALASDPARRTADQEAALREYYRLRVAPGFAPAFATLTALRGRENDILTSLPEVMVMHDRPEPRPTFILTRGAYDAPTQRVSAGTPHILGDLPPALPHNRLGLARWLVDPRHPLTSRVLVNRYWALIFGRGIVPTLADFGSQGKLPTHPALLDWLATTFVESGWDLKQLQKLMVTSATYRQSSVADPALLEADPANDWLARGPSYRLAAEQIRDDALAASGLLVRTIGGPSVYPYQPPGLWEALATRNATKYQQGHGDDLYRRSLYTVWKRSSPPPSAISFDAAERLTCIVNRQRTNTPLQALVLMNDPQYLEASRVLAERMITDGGRTPADRITFGFRLLTSRRPDETELTALERLYETERTEYASDRAGALSLLTAGEFQRNRALDPVETAAYAVVATTVMNFDETVFKR